MSKSVFSVLPLHF